MTQFELNLKENLEEKNMFWLCDGLNVRRETRKF